MRSARSTRASPLTSARVRPGQRKPDALAAVDRPREAPRDDIVRIRAGDPSDSVDDDRPTVLLVEDNELVRVCTADMLGELGYRVEEAASGEEAAARLRRRPLPDFIVTDHAMTGITGVDLARLAHAHFPNLPVLLISGCSDLASVPPDLICLPKPFLKTQLGDHLDLLAARAAAR